MRKLRISSKSIRENDDEHKEIIEDPQRKRKKVHIKLNERILVTLEGKCWTCDYCDERKSYTPLNSVYTFLAFLFE